MQVSVILTNRDNNETRSRTMEFDSYEELDNLIEKFEKETKFKEIDCDIDDLCGDCDRNELDRIEFGYF